MSEVDDGRTWIVIAVFQTCETLKIGFDGEKIFFSARPVNESMVLGSAIVDAAELIGLKTTILDPMSSAETVVAESFRSNGFVSESHVQSEERWAEPDVMSWIVAVGA